LIYKAHHEALNEDNKDITDDSSLVMRLKKPVKMVLGDSYNFKITTFDDLTLLRKLIEG